MDIIVNASASGYATSPAGHFPGKGLCPDKDYFYLPPELNSYVAVNAHNPDGDILPYPVVVVDAPLNPNELRSLASYLAIIAEEAEDAWGLGYYESGPE